MENVEFGNACYEVLEILKYIKEEDVQKIPEDEIQILKRNANYEHNQENGVLHIIATNEANENGDVYYGQSSDYDEYQILVYYDEKIDVASLANNSITVPLVIRYQSMNDEIGTIQGGKNNQITLEEKGDLISTQIQTSDIYNGYINSNITNGTEYETEFTQNTKIEISDLEVDEISLEEANELKTTEGEAFSSEDILYKQIKINKLDFQRILGDDGYLQILNKNGDVLFEIKKDTEAENNEAIFNFETEESGIFIKTSKPIQKGLIRITATKAIKPGMTNLENKYITIVQKIIGNTIKEVVVNEKESIQEEQTSTNEIEESINDEETIQEKETIIENITTKDTEIQEATTNVKVNLDNTQWTNNISNQVNLVATLVTSDEKYNLFNEPTIEIELPDQVEKVVVGDSYLLNANGLSLKSVNVIDKENGRKAIIANIQGNQTEYLFDNVIDGTNVVIPATIILKKEFTTTTNNININYTNKVENRIE